MFLHSDDLTTIIANLLNAGNSELFNQVSIIQDHIHLLESAYRTSKLFNKSTLDLIKTLKHDVNRLQKEMEEEQINLLEEAPIFSKIIKIKDNYFKTKQERDLPLFTQFKHMDIFNSPILYNNYIKNTNLLVCLA